MKRITVSQMQRNLQKMDEWDIVEIIDKKRGQVKGYFLSSDYANRVKELDRERSNTPEKARALRGALAAYRRENRPPKGEEGVWAQMAAERYRS